MPESTTNAAGKRVVRVSGDGGDGGVVADLGFTTSLMIKAARLGRRPLQSRARHAVPLREKSSRCAKIQVAELGEGEMPELPDITVYVEALEKRIAGARLERVRIVSPFLLRTVEPP